jgi:predicted molibdopterin-dependent oxidoreductase YjgC
MSTITMTIDGKEACVPAGATILDAARAVGVEIPTLCHYEGCKPMNSCMVCLVQILPDGPLVPSCGYAASEGLAVASDTDEIHALRRDALELLLGDHLGDCEAPCRMVHPNWVNIPEMIRLVAAGEIVQAAAIAHQHAEVYTPRREGVGPYEKVCRRGRMDAPVAIEQLIDFLLPYKVHEKASPAPEAKPWSVRMGALSPEEIEAQGRLASDARRVLPENRECYTLLEAQAEAKRCLHCDCRKAQSCRLRHWSQVYQADPMRYRKKHHPYALWDSHAKVLFERGKCIACGLCVQITHDADISHGPTYLGRGFDTHIAPPFEADYSEALGDEQTARRCVEVCPTAALSWKDQ